MPQLRRQIRRGWSGYELRYWPPTRAELGATTPPLLLGAKRTSFLCDPAQQVASVSTIFAAETGAPGACDDRRSPDAESNGCSTSAARTRLGREPTTVRTASFAAHRAHRL